MHEMALATSVVDVAERHAAGRPVTLVSLRIGGMRQVVPSSLEFYFEICGKGTLCESARLEYEIVATRLRCGACTHEWEPDLPFFFCPDCASSDCTVIGGEEFEIESIVVEESASCTA
jgi:hydrogenase nickel incorporation protein HypA/HybF